LIFQNYKQQNNAKKNTIEKILLFFVPIFTYAENTAFEKIEHIQKKDKAALPNVNEKTGFSRKN